MKIKELLKLLIETQKQINGSLRDLREDLKLQTSTWAKTTMTVDRLDTCITSNVYDKEQTVAAINKEYDYRENFKECDEKNPALLNLIEDYCKFENKYEIIDLFRVIDSQYEVKARKENK